MKSKKLKDYILFWISQSISQLGSSMTSFALIIWAYTQTKSAMTVSLLIFFTYLPYILISAFVGTFVDTHRKKSIMLWTDSVSCICCIVVLILFVLGRLEIWSIYIVNGIIGTMNAFQSPTLAVVVGILVPKQNYEKISGLNSFSNSLITGVTPMLAASISSIFGLKGVLFIDLISFIIGFITLLFFINIHESEINRETLENKNIFNGCKDGFLFLFQHKGLLYIILSIALMNFFSRLTYENILSPMILTRSSGNTAILGIVSGIIGLGGIIGGVIIYLIQISKNKIKLLYYSAAFSFIFGDFLMGIGENVYLWSIAALAASIPIPFIIASQNVILYNSVPSKMQGRIFAVRNSIQYFTIPIGTLLGGALADYVFEPYMKSTTIFALILQRIVGTGDGSGMAVMFLCTGILGSVTSMIWCCNKQIRKLQK
ncbi:major facilitator superfamily protein [Clostridium pasteurianum DSM 525 = ATCC 6013]|uniref:Major facilitator superfamily protein n=1 Tax=Clostridium pasteurianum DSM 525 = ATCC 6013 TaxID=1262449 RepID=A0A0H3J4Y2_CLOPA|nr:MFS transporter [Clostridium pasteurianum]AJA47013.1 major facilitator superfamily protein [Clostridium pasteurianum DSM 525 = ATCC 6013]AJA51001.1 major facilitator superfamily protein [Clostridium pasteurianum DSM 525 = ATCC 6013]AOZ74387.1 MFS transporter [Clostridium pasteurianum DSM 525 = ATCC 6013]AOZ78184.1 MFS transporter [Clostridium pasteurianum]ELP57472.1 major facilitator superfamily protein [Clostridium pasteurianum DSM 525 = ATCC 6013]